MFKKLLATIAISAGSIFTPLEPALAFTNPGITGLDQHHQTLVDAIQRAGVQIHINVGETCHGGWNGIYKPQEGILGVCQDNAPKIDWGEVEWTDNDLNTLRHEAVHLIQDCYAGDGVGGMSRLLADTDEERNKLAASNLSIEQIRWIFEAYSGAEHPEFTIRAELEAFAGAHKPDKVLVLAGAIDHYCAAK